MSIQTAPVQNFVSLDIRVGRIVGVEEFPEASKPLYTLTIDFGPLGVKRTGAGLKEFYTRDQLMGRLVVAVVNFPPKQIANLRSECLVLAAITQDNRTVLLVPDKETEPGAKIF